MVGSQIKDVVCGSGLSDDDCNLQVTLEISVSEHECHPDFLWYPRPIKTAMKVLASIKKRVIEMNQNCPRGGFILKRTADLQLFLLRPEVVASVLLSPEIDDEVLVMSFDLPVSVMFEQGTTAADSHDFHENLEHFFLFLPSLSPRSENDACFGHVAADELGLEELCNLISSCSVGSPHRLFEDRLRQA